MNLLTLDMFIATIALISYIIFIIITRKSNDFENYAVAGRTVPFFMVFASTSANYIGPGMTLGLTKEGFYNGYFPFFIICFYGLGKIFEGLVFAPKIRSKFTNAYTLGDIVGGYNTHNSKIVKFITGLISFSFICGFCVIMAKSSGDILFALLGIKPIIGTFIVTIIVMSYSIFGGIKSSMQTDFLQFCLFALLIPSLLVFLMIDSNISLHGFQEKCVALTSNTFKTFSFTEGLGLIITWFFGELLVPPTVQSILASKDIETSSKGLVYSGIGMIIWLFLMLTIGIIGNMVLQTNNTDDKILLVLGQNYFKSGFLGLFTVAMVGVVMSSQDSLINSASVIFSKDLASVFFNINENNILRLSRIAGISIAILSAFLSIYVPSLITAILFLYSLWIPSIIVVGVLSIFFKKHSWIAAINSMISGILISTYAYFTNWKPIVPILFICTLISFIIYYITFILHSKFRKRNY